MLAADRHTRILERVAEGQTLQVGQLARELDVSEMTIRRDIAALERSGFLRRTYGGVSAHLMRPMDLAFDGRILQNAGAKRMIGLTAAKLVADASTLFVGVGSTAEQVARFLPHREETTVVTESLPIASLLGARKLKVVILGGTVRNEELSCVGPAATATLERYRADVAVLGAAGLSARHGLTELFEEEAENHRLMIERSDRVLVVADASKLGARAMAQVAPAAAISVLITNEGAPEDELQLLREQGIDVVVVRPGGDRDRDGHGHERKEGS
jgi:DeoR family transcriptional regulator, aga operon transcriptional repressor